METPSARQKLFVGVTLGAVVLFGTILTLAPAFAGTKFKIRGTVTEVNATFKTITIFVTHIQKGWPAVQLGQKYAVRISAKGAGVYQANAEGKLVRLKIESIVTGDSVTVVGETRTDGSLDATKVILR